MVKSGDTIRSGNGRWFRLLLCICAGLFPDSQARATADTLIVDGEVVYVEPRDVLVNLDSLRREGKEDYRKPRKPAEWSFAVTAAAGVQWNRISGTSGDLRPLDSFLGNEREVVIGFVPEAEAAWYPVRDLGVTAGVGFVRRSTSWSGFRASDLSAPEHLLGFESRNGELWQYVRMEIGPGFEVDTLNVPLHRSTRVLNYLLVPMALRFRPDRFIGESRWRPFADFGAAFYVPAGNSGKSEPSESGWLIAESGDYRAVNLSEAERKPSGPMPFVRLGVNWYIQRGWAMRANCFIPLTAADQSVSDGWLIRSHAMALGLGVHRMF
jgi:hypothetical protein